MSETAATFRTDCQAKKHCDKLFYIYIISSLRLQGWPSRATWSSTAQHGQIGPETLQYERVIKKLVSKRHSISGRYCASGNCCCCSYCALVPIP